MCWASRSPIATHVASWNVFLLSMTACGSQRMMRMRTGTTSESSPLAMLASGVTPSAPAELDQDAAADGRHGDRVIALSCG